MKISICIPQYNRIAFLLKNLEWIAKQNYSDIEVVISDDCSKDNTDIEIRKLIPTYKYPIIYKRNEKNLGYDGNLRQSMELATGDYCFILGNDDTLNEPNDIQFLVDFLKENNYPEVGFCNYTPFANPQAVMKRAAQTSVLVGNVDYALKYYSCFIFVAGLIYKKSTFMKYNTSKHDKSIFVQVYLAVTMIADGNRLFMLEQPMVLQDIEVDDGFRNSYKDTLLRKWSDMKIDDRGIFSVMNVVIDGVQNINPSAVNKAAYSVLWRMYTLTIPYWIIDYKQHDAFVTSVSVWWSTLAYRNPHLKHLNFFQKIIIALVNLTNSLAAFVFPASILFKLKTVLYAWLKK